jgi:hypothetical protein
VSDCHSSDIRIFFTCLQKRKGSQDSSVCTAPGYGLDGRGSIPGSGKIFLLFKPPRPALGPIKPPIQWVLGAVSTGVKRPGREADHSSPYRADIKNGAAIPPHFFMA